MKLVSLGSSYLQVPICCLGTMTWGEQNTEEEAHEQLDYALSHGVNFIDTAELYPVPPNPDTQGRTEKYIGNWITSRQCREKIILATKVAGFFEVVDRSWIVANRSDPPTPNPPQPRLSASDIKSAVAASLKRLQTSYVDLIQLHWPDRYVPLWGKNQYDVSQEHESFSFEEQVLAVGELIKEGKVHYWGLSNETTYGVCQFCETAKRLGVPLPVSIQNDFSLVCRNFESELAEACSPSHYNIGLLAYGPLAGGSLSGKYLLTDDPKARHNVFPQFQSRYNLPRTQAAVALYAALAEKKGLTPTQLALAWCKSRQYMTSVIIGATTMEQLKENIAAFDIDLDAETLAEIDAIHVEHRNPTYTD